METSQIIFDDFIEQSYKLNEDIFLIIEKERTYLEIDTHCFLLEDLIAFKEDGDYLTVSNDVVFKKIHKDVYREIFTIIS